MSSSGLIRIRRRTKFRTAYAGRGGRIGFRLYFGTLSLIAGLGIIIVGLAKHL